MIKKYSLMALQTAINQALKLDLNMPEKISALHGKVVKIMIAPFNIDFYLGFSEQQIQLMDEWDGVVNTVIESSPWGFMRLSLLPAAKARTLFNNQVTISGDVGLGQAIKQLFDGVDIDWQSHLATLTGDVFAHQVSQLVAQGKAYQQQVTSSLQATLSDYLHEELRWFPPEEEIRDFFADVDTLALQLERIEARMKHKGYL